MLASILSRAIEKINSCSNISDLEQIRIEFIGKNGLITEQMKQVGTLNPDERKTFGAEVNDVKTKFETQLTAKKSILQKLELDAKLKEEKLDVTLPSRKIKAGSIHPVSHARLELIEIFGKMGFEVKEGPSIETDWYNFTALNIDENHPARQDHDTFYLPSEEDKTILLRTHTSPSQIRTLQNEKPPFRFICPGRTYRSDYDQTHTPMFHQIELMAIDDDITMQNMKYVIIEFIYAFFEDQNPEVRFRPSFFPFTTPSAEVDIRFSGGKWLEVLGCGMVHPKVLDNAGVDSKKYQGFAAGLGIERMAMLKYGIDDLRQFFESDVRWLSNYSFSAFDIPSIIYGLTK